LEFVYSDIIPHKCHDKGFIFTIKLNLKSTLLYWFWTHDNILFTGTTIKWRAHYYWNYWV